MQVAQSSSSHSLSPHESTPPQRSSSNIEQYIHDLDNNSFELDLQFTEEEKQLLLDKQTTGNPWYFHLPQTVTPAVPVVKALLSCERF